jgi:hypothetical protein
VPGYESAASSLSSDAVVTFSILLSLGLVKEMKAS